ncbi:hypothetical protein GH5_06320 [Leishmania sp. Ghana 2012 LV757]|uniref:hypothetical protein n=1 Tax=Leishmania sp. Ghana 2012 LV757 TaxID=2803181 RepID=UPI001B5B0996|nr:hypothetical protein GH5_06320 [Leishmania sp. Ghana 2012 LV757]
MSLSRAAVLAPSSLSTGAEPSDDAFLSHHQCQQQHHHHHLLRCFALADLLGMSLAVRQQLASAAAAPSSSPGRALEIPTVSSHSPPESRLPMQAYQLEYILVTAVLERLFGGGCDVHESATRISRADPTPPAASSILTAPEKRAIKRPASSLTVPLWTPAPSALRSTCRLLQQQNEESRLPLVLSTPQGVARVDALHASFLPCMLVALLQRVSGEGDGGDIYITGAAEPRKGGYANAPKANASAAHLSVEHRRCYRAALQQLLPLYMPLLLKRRRAVCDVVSSIVEAVQGYSCNPRDDGEGIAEENESRKRIHRLVHQNLCCSEFKQWLHAARLLSDTLVASLYRVSRRDAAAATDEDDLMEARWTLEMAGWWLSAARTARRDGAPVAEERHLLDPLWCEGARREAGMSDAEGPMVGGGILGSAAASTLRDDRAPFTTTAEVLALAEVICTVGEEMRDICARDALPPQEQPLQHGKDDHLGQPRQFVPPSVARSSNRTVAAVQDVIAFFLTGHHKNSHDPLRTLWDLEVTATALPHRYVLLLAERLEKEQCQQHRLLAAAERAVHRVLQQQHRKQPGILWQPPGMVVALCSVIAYQVRTQLRRREQRMAELCTATAATAALSGVMHASADSFSSSGDVTAADQKGHSSDGESAENSRNHWCPSTDTLSAAAARKCKQLGETLWSEDDEDDDATEQHEESQERWRAPALRADARLFTPAALPPSTTGTAISMPSPPPWRPPVSSPGPACLSAPLRYTPRTRDLSPVSRVHDALPAMHEGEDAPATADKNTETVELLTRESGDSYAPAWSMEHLWELPAHVPRDWTPGLATLMACCLLCLSPSSSTAATPRLAMLLGVPLLSGHAPDVELTSSTAATAVIDSASAQLTRRVASPRPSLLDFAFNRHHEASVAMAAGGSVHSSVCSSSTNNSTAGVSFALDRTGGGGESASVVGALAQWHLRGLIQQLRLPVHGRVLPSEQAGTDGLRGSHAIVPRTHSTAESSSLASSTGAFSRTSAVPRSTGAAAGGASWVLLYKQTAPPHARAPDATMRSVRSGTSRAASPSLSPAGGVLRRLDPVSLLASCFALMHLLQSHPRFFQQARLGGRTMQELRLGVLEARWGGEPGCATQMLQSHGSVASAVTVSVNSVLRSFADGTACGRAGGAGASWCRRDGLRLARGHSLWDCAVAAPAEAATNGALGVDASHGHGDGGHAGAPLPADAGGSGDNCCDEAAAAAASATCHLTEALLVAVSYLGCRALAAALSQFVVAALVSTEAADTSVISCRGGGIATIDTTPSPRELWCDALQAIAGLLLEAHRAHKGGVATGRIRAMAAAAAEEERSRVDHGSIPARCYSIPPPVSCSVDRAGAPASTVTATARVHMPSSDASAAASVKTQLRESQRAFSLGAPPAATSFSAGHLGHAGHGSYSAVSPPLTVASVPSSLSTEAQFGLGAFFIALVRALLQLHASATGASSDVGQHVQQQHWPQPLMCVVQCLYAVASIIDDLLHDYANATPAVLCDVLAMMLVIQPQQPLSAMLKGVGAALPPPHVSATCTVWEALRLTPFWDNALLGSLETASRAWAYPEKRSDTASPENSEESRSSACQSRLSSVSAAGLGGAPSMPHGPSPPQPSCPPWQSLLGHLPCSRDPFTTTWLPAAFRGSSCHRTSWTLLALLAKEEELLLAGPAHANAAEEIRQLSISLVSSARYAEWIDRLCDAWRV